MKEQVQRGFVEEIEKLSIDFGDPKIIGLIIGAGLGALAAKSDVSKFIDYAAQASKKGALVALPIAGAATGALLGSALKTERPSAVIINQGRPMTVAGPPTGGVPLR